MKGSLIALVAVLCNVGAQLALKWAGDYIERGTGIMAWINHFMILAAVLYVISFVLTAKVFAVNPLTVAAPIMAGATFALVGLAGALILGEAISIYRFAGMGFILIGIVLITLSA